jgi:GT2 family glycosyltransferase
MSARPAVSLVAVAHRSSGVLPAAVDSFRHEAAAVGVTSEVVVVDHSEEADELERLGACRPERLLARPNRGYAAGVNTGAAAATGEVLLVANPDIELRPGALGALLGALREGWGVAGPQFELAGFRFPPADPQGPGEEFRRWLAGRSPAAWRRTFRREVERWRRLWEAARPVEVPALSGALLAVPAAALARVGPWDEGFFLYFEETDWLRRARAAGLRLAAVPAARVEHAWGHAAEPAAHSATFARSRSRFLAKHFGLAGRLAARLAGSPVGPELLAPGTLPAGALLLASPSPLAMPAALAPAGEAPATALARFARAARLASVTAVAWDPDGQALLGVWRWT